MPLGPALCRWVVLPRSRRCSSLRRSESLRCGELCASSSCERGLPGVVGSRPHFRRCSTVLGILRAADRRIGREAPRAGNDFPCCGRAETWHLHAVATLGSTCGELLNMHGARLRLVVPGPRSRLRSLETARGCGATERPLLLSSRTPSKKSIFVCAGSRCFEPSDRQTSSRRHLTAHACFLHGTSGSRWCVQSSRAERELGSCLDRGDRGHGGV
mmetsp:Transcript_61903/g.145057  ORF Transcript_61903/g.145057 Transcript_61903/m.145057 type:complete len:215 (-) Transcript_61903:64-708(-)